MSCFPFSGNSNAGLPSGPTVIVALYGLFFLLRNPSSTFVRPLVIHCTTSTSVTVRLHHSFLSANPHGGVGPRRIHAGGAARLLVHRAAAVVADADLRVLGRRQNRTGNRHAGLICHGERECVDDRFRGGQKRGDEPPQDEVVDLVLVFSKRG